MKNILHLIFLLCWSLPLISGTKQEIPPDGVWYNKHKDRIIVIESGSKGLFVKGIHHPDRSTLFEPIGVGIFTDSHRNRIYLDNEKKMVYKTRSGRKKLTFIKIESHSSTLYSQNIEKESRDNTINVPSVHGRQAPLLPVEGTWDVIEIKKQVFITETRDGLKARLSDEKEWFEYKRNSEDYNIYISQRGSKYEWASDGKMRWISADGKRTLTLLKKSNDF